MKRSIASLSLIALCLTIANPASALETNVRFDALVGPTASSDRDPPAITVDIDEPFGQSVRELRLWQAGVSQAQQPHPLLIGSISKDWKELLKATNRLSRKINRSLASLDPTNKDNTSFTNTRRKRAVNFKRAEKSPEDILALHASQIGVERIAIPMSRPSNVFTIREVRPTPPLTIEAPAKAFGASERNMLGLAAAFLILILAAFVFRNRIGRHLPRKHAQSEKAIYDAIAALTLENRDLQTDVGPVLMRIEEAYGLSNMSIALLQPTTLEVQCAYSSQRHDGLQNELLEEAILEISGCVEERSDLTLWRHGDALRLSDMSNTTKSDGHPDAVTSVVWLGNRFGAMLVAKCRPGREARTTDAKTLQLVTHQLGTVIDGKAQAGTTYAPSAPIDQPANTSEELAGSIAHEFNNLLLSMMGYAEMAADALNPGSSSRAYVERIQSAGERAKRVIEQILAPCRRYASGSSSFDATAATVEILQDLKMCVPASTDIRFILPDSPIHIYGSAAVLQQAVVNLCKNASEAMGGAGTVTVSVAMIDQCVPRTITHGQLTSGRYLRVSVADNGPGIPETDLKQIFSPFFTTKAEEGGTGLGLAMVLRAVKLLNGGLHVISAPNWGTRFDLFLPCPTETITTVPNWVAVAAE